MGQKGRSAWAPVSMTPFISFGLVDSERQRRYDEFGGTAGKVMSQTRWRPSQVGSFFHAQTHKDEGEGERERKRGAAR